MQKEQKRIFPRQRQYKSKEQRLSVTFELECKKHLNCIIANFSEMLETIDDQMMIEALEDFEVSIFTNIMIFKKTVSLIPICLITENQSREDERSGKEEGRERSG